MISSGDLGLRYDATGYVQFGASCFASQHYTCNRERRRHHKDVVISGQWSGCRNFNALALVDAEN